VAFDLADFRLPPERIWRALMQGVPGTAMPAWNKLPESQLRAVAGYVSSLAKTPPLQPKDAWASKSTLMLGGQRVFDTHCTRCHGVNGAGDGPDADKYKRPPANFHQIQVSFAGASYVIRNGVPGSGMPAWPLLTPAEIQAVTVYIRSFYQPPASPCPPGASAAAQAQKEAQ
jgi:mono/diheme cytochrome c family protein